MDKVIVSVSGEQADAAGERSVIEMTAEGRHYFKSGKHYILYDDHSLTEGEAASTVLKIAPDSLELIRKGAVMSRQFFAKAYEDRCMYQTPLGSLDLTVRTESLEIAYGTVSGSVDVSYAVLLNGEPQGKHALHIEVCADEGYRS